MPQFTTTQLNFYVWVFMALTAAGLVFYFWVNPQFSLTNDSTFEIEVSSHFSKENVTHDDAQWFIDGKSTCVGYGDPSTECPRYRVYCSSRKPPAAGGGFSFGTAKEQAFSIRESIKWMNAGQEGHPRCPV